MRIAYTSVQKVIPEAMPTSFAPWPKVPHIPWANVVEHTRQRLVGAVGRKLGDLELSVVLEEIDRLRAPRVALDLREVGDPDDLKTSEVHAVGPALQRALAERPEAPLLLYRFDNDDVAQAFSDQLTLHSTPARGGRPAEPLLALGEVHGQPRVLGPLPNYLEPVWRLLAERGELTAADLTDAHGTALATASDYLGELHRLRVSLRERESLPAGGSRFVYSLALDPLTDPTS
jgi:hypothetical protein